jgi:hypothetical protein
MKRKRTSGEDEENTVQPLSGSEPEPSAGENSEPDDVGDAQQPAAEESDKRRKVQEKLKKLKKTYENRGKGLPVFLLQACKVLSEHGLKALMCNRYHIHQQDSSPPGK